MLLAKSWGGCDPPSPPQELPPCGVIVADSSGQCYYKDMKYVSGKTAGTWKCTAKCKELTQFEVDTVLEFKSYFEKSLHDVMSLLSMCDDDCPNTQNL